MISIIFILDEHNRYPLWYSYDLSHKYPLISPIFNIVVVIENKYPAMHFHIHNTYPKDILRYPCLFNKIPSWYPLHIHALYPVEYPFRVIPNDFKDILTYPLITFASWPGGRIALFRWVWFFTLINTIGSSQCGRDCRNLVGPQFPKTAGLFIL